MRSSGRLEKENPPPPEFSISAYRALTGPDKLTAKHPVKHRNILILLVERAIRTPDPLITNINVARGRPRNLMPIAETFVEMAPAE